MQEAGEAKVRRVQSGMVPPSQQGVSSLDRGPRGIRPCRLLKWEAVICARHEEVEQNHMARPLPW